MMKNKALLTTQITITLVIIISFIAEVKNYITSNVFSLILVLMVILFTILSSRFRK